MTGCIQFCDFPIFQNKQTKKSLQQKSGIYLWVNGKKNEYVEE